MLLNIQVVTSSKHSWWSSSTFLQLQTVSDIKFLVPLQCTVFWYPIPSWGTPKMSAVTTLSCFACCHVCWTLSSPCPNHAHVGRCVSPKQAQSRESLSAGSRTRLPFLPWTSCFTSLVGSGLLVCKMHQLNGSLSGVTGSATSTSPQNLWEMQVLRPPPRTPESEPLGVKPSNPF